MIKIFIVEDDPAIARGILELMRSWGYDAKCADDFRNVRKQFEEFEPNLVLLDISLPFFNGYYWCRELRAISKTPIIFISSASDNMNIVMAINMGGDDFIAKPFDASVLMAKVQAMLRRAYDFAAPASTVERGGATLNMGDQSLEYSGARVELTRNEYRILLTLMERSGSVVSRETLMEKLWETDSFVDENTLTVNVARLRRKLDGAGLENYIRTRKGAGYIVE